LANVSSFKGFPLFSISLLVVVKHYKTQFYNIQREKIK